MKTGDLNPHYFRKPTLIIYANALLYLPYYAMGKARGDFASPADIPGPERQAMGVGHIGAPGAVVMGRSLDRGGWRAAECCSPGFWASDSSADPNRPCSRHSPWLYLR